MIKVNSLINLLKKNSCDFFTGVPDSILKYLFFYLKNKNKKNHIIARTSFRIGTFAKSKIPCIYMKILNPLISIDTKKFTNSSNFDNRLERLS